MKGFGGLVALDLAGGYQAARVFIERLRVFELAVSLGGTTSLAVHVASMLFPHLTGAERARAGVSDGIVRLSIGLEDPEDLLEDVAAALAGGGPARAP
jgi:cystathionine beta-lyase/cystathionine gamma-synthase